ncbi:NAD-dependent epimerase/dehydratase family protein [Sphaerotilus mobilis]|uniref:Nucleoside-diphosphate-sugar epimerase n=1 Tax=Sphaerotilus mobilis TaxID=47994 RepID=A0A4Q7LWD8_9BURK|nr:NAD-dependent epimerase/dehydratase family protein [Sphaerotilus mobilis]RZS58762.1 nucleoside-diphosphate-sugar epimerase [Sphaerotilus mobilis]
MTAPTVLILGAAGRLGSAAVIAFAAAGWRVLAQQRKATSLPEGVDQVSTPLHDTAALAAQAVGAQVVVYAVNPPYDRWDQELLPLARQGMDVAEALGATLLLPGNVYNFGPDMPARLDVDTPQPGGTPKGRQRCAMEAELRERTSRGRMKATVIRAGDFYGHGVGSWLDQAMAKDIARGKLVYPGPLDLPHAWAYLPDLARAFVAVAERCRHGAAPVFETLMFEGHTLTGHELLAHLQQAAADLGHRPASGWRIAGLPWGVIRLIGLFRPVMRELARMSYLWRVPHAIDGRSLVDAVGPLAGTAVGPAVRAAVVGLGLVGPAEGARIENPQVS